MASLQPSSIRQAIAGWWGQGSRNEVLPGYAGGQFWQRRPLLCGLIYLGVLAAYGLVLGMTGRLYLMALVVPLVVMALLIIWVLPESKNPPLRAVRFFLFGFIMVLLGWPDYLAFDLPGLPWITAVRLFAFPLAAVLLISLSTSSRFRAEIAETLAATPWTWKLVAAFAAIAAMSVAFSKDPAFSANRFVVAMLYWIMIYFCCAWVFRKPGAAMTFAAMIWGFAVLMSLAGALEWRMQALPWAGHIPSFLTIDDPVLQTILAAKSRATTGIYRIQSKFLTPLSFAEFLALSTPVVLFFVLYGRSLLVKLAAGLSILLIGFCVYRTDSRLGMGGFMLSFLMMLLAWAVLRWRQVKGSILGPAVTLAYPALFAAFITATFFVGRLRVMVWGGGAQSFSSQAREEQVSQGIPMILSQPWGRGIGRGAAELGFTNPGGILTIDTYFLQVGLEFGVIGFLVYYGMFVAQAYYSAFAILKARTTEQMLVAPLIMALVNFVVIKTVLSQQENHAFVFAILGTLTALIWRINTNDGADPLPRPHKAARERAAAR